mgnify:CR=1 FL=1
MIRNGKFCKYHGNEFKVNRDSDGNTIILTKNDKIIDSTFIDKYGSGVYSKKVSLEEIEELYRYATYAVINNYKVNVEKENEKYYIQLFDENIFEEKVEIGNIEEINLNDINAKLNKSTKVFI